MNTQFTQPIPQPTTPISPDNRTVSSEIKLAKNWLDENGFKSVVAFDHFQQKDVIYLIAAV